MCTGSSLAVYGDEIRSTFNDRPVDYVAPHRCTQKSPLRVALKRLLVAPRLVVNVHPMLH